MSMLSLFSPLLDIDLGVLPLDTPSQCRIAWHSRLRQYVGSVLTRQFTVPVIPVEVPHIVPGKVQSYSLAHAFISITNLSPRQESSVYHGLRLFALMLLVVMVELLRQMKEEGKLGKRDGTATPHRYITVIETPFFATAIDQVSFQSASAGGEYGHEIEQGGPNGR
ncbi:hypothetical protein BDQ12DRAFT_726955 [Crucibulum laeve]|uniref:Uncharacterized protein n=1 Tax=Crucibulum laeve TaxID=68775 RepID=A0A5C3LMK9_9AGAR|nr:hypothetical protein BDQ12DRAFT_726955 [Crucibulum laeve]